MMYHIIGLLSILLFSACAEQNRTAGKPVAQVTAETVRDGWKKSCRPLAVVIENGDGITPSLPHIGVFASVKDATPEEREAFSGVCFHKHGEHYESADKEAVTADTLATVYVYFPYRQGIDTDNSLTLDAPFTENLFGIEKSRAIGDQILLRTEMRSAMALLRINMESDDLHDMLDDIRISGENIYTSGCYQPCRGIWNNYRSSGFIQSTTTGCVLNNGQAHDFYLIPTSVSGMLTVIVSVNRHEMVVKTTLPPMRAGSLTQLNLRKGESGITVNSSWVETERSLVPLLEESPDSVCAGHFLQADGRISKHRNEQTVAVVIESDGKHGKAVGIKDCSGDYHFSTASLSSGKLFPSIDGKRQEGILNPPRDSRVDSVSKVIFKPGMPYRTDCALGYADGAKLTSILLRNRDERDNSGSPETDMLSQASSRPAGYVPTLAEMASLYYLLQTTPCHPDMDTPAGEYLTSSEATATTVYIIDMTHGIMTGNASKRYFRGKLRLFYLF